MKERKKVTRQSSQRRLVWDYLRGTDKHPTAEQVYRAVKFKRPTISFATVYRNLGALAKENKIIELKFNHEEAARYDPKTSFHFHFICRSCSKIFDVDRCPLPALRKGLSLLNGRPDNYRLDFYGLCRDCQT